MFKTTAFLAAVAIAEPTLIQTNDALTFTQEDDQAFFSMDPYTTFGEPAYPVKGQDELFTVGGFGNQDFQVANMRFQCVLFGALVYDEQFPCPADQCTVSAGQAWESPAFPFTVYSYAPPGKYNIKVMGQAADGTTEYFTIDTSFNL